MEIKNGLVQWNGRNDIPCSYVDMEDGSRYYIKQDLSNGNHIVTTSLLEAVDPMTKAQNIGLIDKDGNMIISSNNSSIKVIDDDLLLVVPSEAVSENVKEAISLRLDPLAATRLVSTPAQIKEKINAKMSAEGRYELYDQFQEGTLCDANGNNLLNDEYYSFVAKDNDKILLAKNSVDTDVIEFSVSDKKIVEENKEVVPTEAVEQVEVTEPVTEVVTEEVSKDDEIPYEFNFVYENGEDLGEEVSIPVEETPITNDFSFDEITNETPTEVVDMGEGAEVTEEVSTDRESDIDKRLDAWNEKYTNMNSELSQFESQMRQEPEDRFAGSELHEDSIETVEDEDYTQDYSDVEDNIVSEENTTYSDAANVIRSLMQNGSELKEELNRTKEERDTIREELDKAKASRKALSEKFKSQTRELEARNDENRDLRATISKVENERDSFEGKFHDLKRVNDLQKRELEKEKLENQKLRMKLASKDADRDELDQLVREARAQVNENRYYDEDNYSYRMVA